MQRGGRGAQKFWSTGAPLVAFVVVGSVGLSHLVQGRKDAQDARQGPLSASDAPRMPAARARAQQFDITKEHEVRPVRSSAWPLLGIGFR